MKMQNKANTREKLIELLEQQDDVCVKGKLCSECDYENLYKCYTYTKADHLIANGVTFAKDNNAPSKWIPVTERLPEYKTKVLTRSKMGTNGHFFYIAELWFLDNRLAWVSNEDIEPLDIAEITHWMPLPEPPEEG